MCVYIAIIATILSVTLWRIDSEPALKCNSYRLKSLLCWGQRERQCALEGRYVNVWGSVHWKGVYLCVE